MSKLDRILQRDDVPSEVKREIKHFNKSYQELEEFKNQLQLKEEEIKLLKQKQTVNDRIVDIFTHVTNDNVYSEVLQVILDVLESKSGIFGYINREGSLVCPSISKNILDQFQIPDKDIVFPRGSWGETWQQMVIHKKTLCSNESFKVPKGHIPITRVLGIPIIYRGEIIAMILAANKTTDYNENDQQLLESIANFIAPILHTRLQRDQQTQQRIQTQNDLIKAQTRLSYLLQSGPAIIYACEPGGDYQTTFMSENVNKILGHRAHEFLYNHNFWFNRIHPEDRQRTVNFFSKIVQNGSYKDVYRFQHKDGTYHWMLEEANLIRDGRGKPVEIVGYWTDVTTLKNAEETLKKRSYDLRERVKELTCLFEISKLVAEPNKSEEKFFSKAVELIPLAWQYPEITCVQIIFESITYSTKNFQETSWRQSADIIVAGKKAGSIKICYLEERPESDEGPFLKEERNLINTIATELGKYIERKQIEELLRNERQNFFNILNSTDDAIYVVNSEHEIIFINAITEKEFGPVEGRKCYEYFNDFSEACSWCTMKDVFNGKTIRREKTLPKNQKTYDMIDTPFRNLDGNIASLAILRDITKRKIMEEALKKSKARLEYLLASGPAVIYSCLPKDNYQITFISENVKSVTGYDPQEVLADPNFIDKRIHPKDRQRIISTLNEISKQDNYQAAYRFQHKNGNYIWILEEARLIFDEQGKALDRIGYLTDITESMRAEEALRVSEEKYRSLVENFKGIAFKGYEDYSQDLFSGNVEEITGYTEEEFLTGKILFKNLIHPEDSQKIASDVAEFHSSSREFTQREYRIIDKYGKVRWLQEDIQKFSDEDKEKSGVYGTIQEITKRKKAEDGLRKSEEKLRNLIEESTDGITLADEDGLIIEWNKSMEKITGLEKEEVLGKFAWDINFLMTREALRTPEHYERDKTIFLNLLKKGEALTNLNMMEAEIATPSGVKRRIQYQIFPIRTFDRFMIGSIIRDITEHKKTEEALKKSEERLRAFMDSATDSFILLDSKLNIVEVNKNLTDTWNLSKAELIGKNIMILSNKLILNSNVRIGGTNILAQLSDVINMGEDNDREFNFSHPKYGEVYFSVKAFKVGTGVGIIIRNITDRMKAEKAREDLEQRRDSFVWMTSHELRTPLTVLTGYSDFLLEHINDLTQKRIMNILSVMKSNLERLERLTDKVTTIGQIEHGIFEIEKTAMKLCEFLQNTVEPYQLLLGGQFKFQGCLVDPSTSIEGDPNRLQQVLDNIIGNAIKQTDKNHRKIMVTSKIYPTNIKIEVSDNGAGIASKDLEIIFEQFVSIPTEYSATGTGIGLYLCRKILTAHGGTIKAQSKGPGYGATFVIELPTTSNKN